MMDYRGKNNRKFSNGPPSQFSKFQHKTESKNKPNSNGSYRNRSRSPLKTERRYDFQDKFKLPKINWSGMNLIPIKKNFYRENHVVSQRSDLEIMQFRNENEMSVMGQNSMKPVFCFSEINLESYIVDVLLAKSWNCPTPIQAQGLPIVLSGRNIVGIARTGSGKTGTYLIPAVVHIKAQPSLQRGEGPVCLVLVPTRELAQQVHSVASDFLTRAGLSSVCCYGGSEKGAQIRALSNGAEVIIATPGRLIDLLESNKTNLIRTTFLVLDEADRMLDMGFEPQIRKILDRVRPDRQTLMWSATWPRDVEKLAHDFVREYDQVNIGSRQLHANPSIFQNVEIVNEDGKTAALMRIVGSQPRDKIIVFTATKKKTEEICRLLRQQQMQVGSMHSNKSQQDRESILFGFRNNQINILVATDVASRGLDVDDVKVVINYDFPCKFEDYIHRIGRTGRNGKTGVSFTFFTVGNRKHAKDLVDVMHDSHQQVPNGLYDMAMIPREVRKVAATKPPITNNVSVQRQFPRTSFTPLNPNAVSYIPSSATQNPTLYQEYNSHQQIGYGPMPLASNFSTSSFPANFSNPAALQTLCNTYWRQ